MPGHHKHNAERDVIQQKLTAGMCAIHRGVSLTLGADREELMQGITAMDTYQAHRGLIRKIAPPSVSDSLDPGEGRQSFAAWLASRAAAAALRQA